MRREKLDRREKERGGIVERDREERSMRCEKNEFRER